MSGCLFSGGFRLKLPGIDPIPATIRYINRDHPGTGVGTLQAFYQGLRIGRIGKGTDLYPQPSHLPGSPLVTNDL